jgi:hypothetical protein
MALDHFLVLFLEEFLSRLVHFALSAFHVAKLVVDSI